MLKGISPEKEAKILKLLKAGKKYDEIIVACGTSSNTITKVKRAHNMDVRDHDVSREEKTMQSEMKLYRDYFFNEWAQACKPFNKVKWVPKGTAGARKIKARWRNE